MKPTKLLLVDDHEIFLDGLESLLSTSDQLNILGKALNGRLALEKIASTPPDVLITDLSMPEMDGIEALREILETDSQAVVITLSGGELGQDNNEAAKLHVRHMVGGRAFGATDELLYRFEFPERPGALAGFLAVLGTGWNITMFHYRNHGAAWGRVLVGFEAAAKERGKLTKYLQRIGYRYWEETDNPAYQLFLR